VTTYLLRRIGFTVPVLLGVSVLVFLMIRMVPGDVIDRIMGPDVRITAERRADLERIFGLDRTMPEQYLSWLGGVVRGDLGTSLLSRRPVAADLRARLPVTLQLGLMSLAVALLIGVPLGLAAALRRDTWVDYLATLLALIGMSIPNFWLGTILVLVFSLSLGWLPSAGYVTFLEDPVRNLRLMALPVASLAIVEAAVVMRMVRGMALDVLSQDFVRTAHAKGLAAHAVTLRHVLPNTLVPVITVVGLSTGYLLSGTIIIEEIFSIPGLGRLALMAVHNRDYPVLQGSVLVIAGIYLLVNLLVDLAYGVVDPRIRYD
jgi:peptide/nickel transport system permease protein